MLQWIGIASWVYVAVNHLIFLRDAAHDMELQANCTSVLVALTKTEREPTTDEEFILEEHLTKCPWYEYYVMGDCEPGEANQARLRQGFCCSKMQCKPLGAGLCNT